MLILGSYLALEIQLIRRSPSNANAIKSYWKSNAMTPASLRDAASLRYSAGSPARPPYCGATGWHLERRAKETSIA